MSHDEPSGRRADKRCHAFCDDALGDLDAVGLVDALQTRKVSAGELVEAAIARTKAVNPTLNGLAFEAFDRARARAYLAHAADGPVELVERPALSLFDAFAMLRDGRRDDAAALARE